MRILHLCIHRQPPILLLALRLHHPLRTKDVDLEGEEHVECAS